MVPLIELRGAIPYSQVMGLPLLESYIIAIIGNMLPGSDHLFICQKGIGMGSGQARDRRIFYVVSGKGKHGGEKLQAKAGRGLFVALLLFVGIPLPGHGRMDRYAGGKSSRYRLQIQYPRGNGRCTACRSHNGTGQCGRFGSA